MLKRHENFIGDMDVFEDCTQLGGYLFLAEARRVAFPAVAGAAIINVLAFLALCGDGAIVLGTGQHPAEGNFLFAVFRLVVPDKHRLHAVIKGWVNEDVVCSAIGVAAPNEVSHVEGIGQHGVQIGLRERLTGFGQDGLSQRCQRMLTCGIELEYPPHDGRILRVNLNCALGNVVVVTERRTTRVYALLGLLPHPLLHLFAEIFDVMAGEDQMHSMDELGLRLGILGNDLALFDQVNFDVQVLQRHGIPEVAVKPIGLFHQDSPTTAIELEEFDHLAEVLPAAGLGRFNVHELFQRPKIIAESIFPQQF